MAENALYGIYLSIELQFCMNLMVKLKDETASIAMIITAIPIRY